MKTQEQVLEELNYCLILLQKTDYEDKEKLKKYIYCLEWVLGLRGSLVHNLVDRFSTIHRPKTKVTDGISKENQA